MTKREELLEETVPGVDKENGQGRMPWREGWAGTPGHALLPGCPLKGFPVSGLPSLHLYKEDADLHSRF